MIETKKVFPKPWAGPFPNFKLCEDMVSRGLMKIFMDDGSTYLSADHFWIYETKIFNFKFIISLDGKFDRNKFGREIFDRKF